MNFHLGYICLIDYFIYLIFFILTYYYFIFVCLVL